MKWILVSLCLNLSLAIFLPISNAVPNNKQYILKSETEKALYLPIEKRYQELKAQGPDAYSNLVKIMNDEKEEIEMKWRSVTAMAEIAGELAKPELNRARQSKYWYLRNAALLSMVQVDPELSQKWAREMLTDKALVVRSAAVDILKKFKDPKSKEILWAQLKSKENFRGKQGLWIRPQIVEALSHIEGRGSEEKFISLLEDQDASLYNTVILALEKMTDQKIGSPGENIQQKRAAWIKWWHTQVEIQ